MRRYLRQFLRAVRRIGAAPASPPAVFSVLVLSIPERVERFLAPLLRSLEGQIERPGEVEVLCLVDNRLRSIGEKRNHLLRMAAGGYCAFVDDDDRVADDYVASILEAVRAQPDRDVYCFDVWVNGYHRLGYTPPEGMLCRYGVEFDDRNLPEMFTRRPNHLMVHRTALARRVRFPHVDHGEDGKWAEAMAKHVRKQGRIEKVLYYYDFDIETSATPVSREWRRRRNRAEPTAGQKEQ